MYFFGNLSKRGDDELTELADPTILPESDEPTEGDAYDLDASPWLADAGKADDVEPEPELDEPEGE